MKRIILIAGILLLAACGGNRIELNNGSGMDLETVTVTIGENSETWTNIEADETFGTDIPVTDATLPVAIVWESGGETWNMEYMLIENAGEAKRISIFFAQDEVSINYSF